MGSNESPIGIIKEGRPGLFKSGQKSGKGTIQWGIYTGWGERENEQPRVAGTHGEIAQILRERGASLRKEKKE